jgi:hypothetical protein
MAKREERASPLHQGAIRPRRRFRWIGVLVVAGALGAWWGSPARAPRVTTSDPALSQAPVGQPRVRGETRPTLDPARFVGKAAVAHQVAREIPDVLDQLYCYCGCDKLAGHKSLLSCYTDGHAAT